MPDRPKNFRLLVVDDDEGLLVLISGLLAGEGYAVTTANSGTEALRLAQKVSPHLMLLDLQLKDVGGEKLLGQLEAQRNSVPFVVITGRGDEKVAVEMMKCGALDYVMKDSALLDLLPGVVRRALMVAEGERMLESNRLERARLQREVIAISEQEQRRIGADLHDGLGQQLTALELMCASLRVDTLGQPGLAKQVNLIAQGLREAVAQVRVLAHGLVPVSDDPDSLYRGLVELTESVNRLGQFKCRLDCPGTVQVAQPAMAKHLYRIAQEALNNAMKYSRATELTVTLSQQQHELTLRISDNGGGFSGRKRRGIGIEVMKHRAGEIGARLAVESHRGRGVTVTCIAENNP